MGIYAKQLRVGKRYYYDFTHKYLPRRYLKRPDGSVPFGRRRFQCFIELSLI